MTTGKTITEELSMSLTPIRLYIFWYLNCILTMLPLMMMLIFWQRMFHFIQGLGFFQIPKDYEKPLGNHFNISEASHCPVVKASCDQGQVFCNLVRSPPNWNTLGEHTLFLTSPLLYFILATESFTENEYAVTCLLSFCDKSEELSVSSCVK